MILFRDVDLELDEIRARGKRRDVDLDGSRRHRLAASRHVLHLHAEVEISVEINVARSAEEAERQSKGESLTSADAIYGVDEDALTAADFFDPEADGIEEEDA